MKPELENLKEYTSKLSLTSQEKLDMFNNLRAYSNANPVRSKYSMLFRHSFTYATIFTLLIGTSATAFAAENALPGDILYPIKTEINESVVKALSFSPVAKAKVAVNLMDKRMSELEQMIVQEVDSPEKIDIIVAKLEEHKADLKEFANQVTDSNQQEIQEASEVYVALESVIDTHIDILEDITRDENIELVVASTAEAIALTTITPTETGEQENAQVDIATIDMDTENSAISDIAPTQEIVSATSTDPELAGETDAINEILNFSTRIDPLIDSVKDKDSNLNDEVSTQIKNEVRKRILETAEDKLQIEVNTNQ